MDCESSFHIKSSGDFKLSRRGIFFLVAKTKIKIITQHFGYLLHLICRGLLNVRYHLWCNHKVSNEFFTMPPFVGVWTRNQAISICHSEREFFATNKLVAGNKIHFTLSLSQFKPLFPLRFLQSRSKRKIHLLDRTRLVLKACFDGKKQLCS